MSNLKILYLSSFKFRTFDWNRFEFSKLEKEYNAKIIVHEIIDIVYPHFTKAYPNVMKSSKVETYFNFKEWLEAFKKIKRDDYLIITNISPNNYNSFLICNELKKSKLKILEYSSAQNPELTIPLTLANVLNRIYTFIKNPIQLKYYLNAKFFYFLGKHINFRPTHAIRAGSDHFYCDEKKTEVIEGNSYDYSNFLIKRVADKQIQRDHILYLETAGPLFHGDNILVGRKMSEWFTSEIWFPSLNKFFYDIEAHFKLKIKIAPHPKTNHKSKFPDYYNKREIISTSTAEASNTAKIIISRDSQGLSFAVLQNIPAIMIYSKELKRNINWKKKQDFFAKQLGIAPINIDSNFDIVKINNCLNINYEEYKKYKKKYLSMRTDEKPNYKIIGETFS